jgi:Domain of unknown function (DUF4845)
VNRVPLWRKAAGCAVLAAMAFFLAVFSPIYYHNFQLRNYVETLTRSAESRAAADDLLRTQVMEKAHQLNLPSVTADDVHVIRSTSEIRIEVRYRVPVDLPGYTVMLHFYPGAGSR